MSKFCDADLNKNLKKNLTNISEDFYEEEEIGETDRFFLINRRGRLQLHLRTEKYNHLRIYCVIIFSGYLYIKDDIQKIRKYGKTSWAEQSHTRNFL